MDIKQYIAESERVYKLRARTVVALDDAAMDKIEAALSKYFPLEISRPKKTILQSTPLDFPNVQNAEVWIVDMVLGVPTGEKVAQEAIRAALDAPESFVLVRDPAAPLEVEGDRREAIATINAEAAKRGLRPLAMLDDAEYSEVSPKPAEDFYGDAYNQALLHYLGKVEDEHRDRRVQFKTPLFANLDLPKADADDTFNDGVKDAPKVHPKSGGKVPEPKQKITGSVDDGAGEVTRVFVDANGKRVVLSQKIREGK